MKNINNYISEKLNVKNIKLNMHLSPEKFIDNLSKNLNNGLSKERLNDILFNEIPLITDKIDKYTFEYIPLEKYNDDNKFLFNYGAELINHPSMKINDFFRLYKNGEVDLYVYLFKQKLYDDLYEFYLFFIDHWHSKYYIYKIFKNNNNKINYI